MIAAYYAHPTKKSIPFKALSDDFKIQKERAGSLLNYLPQLNIYMAYKTKQKFESFEV
jgi:hypothetical protein